ncbi:hypothetical protein [Streptomyces cylindrosporus]|uniref:Uncharacterized protein n=1 Tax=Streptomyces cylindrosporus TaxID=2927583 RepID=A0ABS9YPR7_9ACTN|nr:hypothetical protein [Streptomyces cylindrosporus]MCI3279129.1 hypothetical protein [Streptomyces cylindrosporus]
MDQRETLGYALYRWDDTTTPTRTDHHYLEAAGLAITHGGANLDSFDQLVENVSLWDAAAGPIPERRRADYLELADILMKR